MASTGVAYSVVRNRFHTNSNASCSSNSCTQALEEKGRPVQSLTLFVLPGSYAFCRLHPNGHIPHWALLGDEFISLTRTHEELSVVCLQDNVPLDAQAERDWRCIKVEGPFDFSVSGVHASLALPLAQANISVMAIATYETDHLLLKEQDLAFAVETLRNAGHTFR